MRKVRIALRWGLPVVATVIAFLAGQSLKWKLTSEITLAFAAGAFTFGVAWLLIYCGALELRHQRVAVVLALIPAILIFGIFAQASGFWGFVALVTGDEKAGEARETVQVWVAEQVATPVAVKHATVQADKDAPGAMKWVVEQAYKAFQPTPTETPVGFIAPPTATPTPKPGQIPVLVGELSPRDWEKAGVTPTVEPVFEDVVLQLFTEPEGKLVGTSQRAETGGAGRYFFPGGNLDKGEKYLIRIKSAPQLFDTEKVKLWREDKKKLEDPIFIYEGESMVIRVIIFRKE